MVVAIMRFVVVIFLIATFILGLILGLVLAPVVLAIAGVMTASNYVTGKVRAYRDKSKDGKIKIDAYLVSAEPAGAPA